MEYFGWFHFSSSVNCKYQAERNGQLKLSMVWKENKHVSNTSTCISDHIHYMETQSKNFTKHLDREDPSRHYKDVYSIVVAEIRAK